MASQVDICNLALANLGQSPDIISINPPDGGKYAAACAQFYPIALDKVLGECDWQFAVKEVSLSSIAITLPDAWQYAFAVPSDLVKPVNAFEYHSGSPFCSVEFEIRGDALYCNTASVVLRYVFRNTATSNYHNTFVMAMAAYLAHLLAAPVTKDPNVTRGWHGMYKTYLAEAMIDNHKHTRVYRDDTPAGVRARWL
jgi:hypothetical protein